jgi:Tol biopolymer transport system component
VAGDIWEVSLGNPNSPVKLPVGQDAFDVTMSSKAKRLAFAQSRTNVNIWRLELGAIEKHARMVIASTREQRAPDISPNGDQVAFESNRSGSNEVLGFRPRWVECPSAQFIRHSTDRFATLVS